MDGYRHFLQIKASICSLYLLPLYSKRSIMKNAIIILAILCFPVFAAFSKTDADKFIGTWKAAHTGNTVKSLVIKKTGEKYFLSYTATEPGQGAEQKKFTLMYLSKDGSLTSAGAPDFGTVTVITSSGHLVWYKDEWEKTSDKTE
jgi:hypothetical protein